MTTAPITATAPNPSNDMELESILDEYPSQRPSPIRTKSFNDKSHTYWEIVSSEIEKWYSNIKTLSDRSTNHLNKTRQGKEDILEI